MYEKWTKWLYFSPIIAIFSIVYIYPLAYVVWLSFQKTQYFSTVGFGGLSNYIRFLTDGDLLIINIRNTLLFAGSTLVVALLLGLFAAILLQQTSRLSRVLRVLLLLPWLMSQAMVGAIWFWFLNPNYGPVADIAERLGISKIAVFSEPKLAMSVLILITAWWSYPQAMVFFLGALQTVPVELKESILIDGGGRWASFRHITIPFIYNSLVMAITVLLMLYVQMVTLILVTTAGGPLRSTETLSMRVFNQLFNYLDLSGAAVGAIFLMVFNSVLTLLIIRLRRREMIL